MCKSLRFLSFIITFVFLLSFGGLSAQRVVPVSAASSRTYYVFNAQTGTRYTSRNYTLGNLPYPTGIGSSQDQQDRNVIGSDDRVIDFTKSGTVKLMSSTHYIGSGFVVDSHTIATAAHCVANSATSGISISEILLFNSSGSVALHATPVESHVPMLYFTSSAGGYDYALVSVEEDLSSYNCFYLGAPTNSIFSSSMSISVTGFPQTVNNNIVNSHSLHTMYTGTGTITSTNSTGLLHYNADSSGGNSGGPVYKTTLYKGNVYFTVIAIHTTGGSTENSGTRITSDLLHFYRDNANIQY